MERNKKKCPYCGKEIMAVARKCRFCGRWIEESIPNVNQLHQQDKSYKQEHNAIKYVILCIIVVAIIILAYVFLSKPNSHLSDDDTYSPAESVEYNTDSAEPFEEPEADYSEFE